MENYKSSIARLARLFKKSRDIWKQRSDKKQDRIKSLEIKVRDLSQSREQWKSRAKAAFVKLSQNSTEFSESLLEDNPRILTGEFIPAGECSTSKPVKHQFPVYVIHLAVEQVIVCLNSFRGIQKTFESFGQYFRLPRPSFSTVRHWMLRLGVFQLLSPAAFAADWIFLIDLTATLGTNKGLVILGIRQCHLQELLSQPEFSGLKHTDMELLSIEILNSTKGEIIESCLEKVSNQVGIPKQIISDHGSDVKKGVELFVEQHPQTIYTYDVSHYMALLFQHELANDTKYQSFVAHCGQTRSQIQQTQLNFLKPTSQRTKSRYLNVEEQINWGIKILNYQDQGDFTAISTVWQLDSESHQQLKGSIPEPNYLELSDIVNQTYSSKAQFQLALSQLPTPLDEPTITQILALANLGQKSGSQRLGWIEEFREELPVYAQMVFLVHLAEKQLSHQGISADSSAQFLTEIVELPLTPRLESFKDRINNYLITEGHQIPANEVLWSNTNVLESLFGKYKLFLEQSPLSEVSPLILTIPLSTIKMTGPWIKIALETISFSSVQKWASELFKPSTLAKQRAAFPSRSHDTDLA